MSIAAGDIVRVVAKMTDVNGSEIQNVYFFKNQGDATVSDGDFLTAIETRMSSAYGKIEDQMPSTLDPLEIEVDKVQFVSGKLDTIGSVGTVDWTTWSGGASAAEGLPQGNAAVVNFPTGVSGVVGRKYFGPLVEATQNNGELDNGALADLALMAAELLVDVLAGTELFENVIMSTKQAAPVQILGTVIRTVLGYQRRRKAGRGI